MMLQQNHFHGNDKILIHTKSLYAQYTQARTYRILKGATIDGIQWNWHALDIEVSVAKVAQNWRWQVLVHVFQQYVRGLHILNKHNAPFLL